MATLLPQSMCAREEVPVVRSHVRPGKRIAWWIGGLVVGVSTLAGRPAGQTAQPSAAVPAAPRPSPFVPPEPLDYENRAGWTSMFDGRTLTGWDGNPDVWSVENGVITASSTSERRVGSTHLIWQGGEVADFEWKFELKLDGDIHSGVAYRSVVDVNRGSAAPARQGGAAGTAPAAGRTGAPAGRAQAAPLAVPANPKWTLYGPGLDYDADLIMAGNVEDRGASRREVAWRGGIVRAEAGVRPRLIGSLGDPDALKAFIKVSDWNQIHIIARGNQLTHIINGHVMAILLDEDPAFYRASGQLGLQIESYGLGRVSVRNLWIRK